MSSVLTIWDQIRANMTASGVPDKPRAMLREYLQIKALDFLYSQKGSDKLSFIGGTSLRLLANLPRFSEDLDFDNLGVDDKGVINLVRRIATSFEAENIPVELFENMQEGKTYFELRFPQLLKELGISTNPREKLMIKVDYSCQWKGQKIRTVLLRRLGVVQSIVTNNLDQVLVEKLTAYIGRKNVQPRDMYDVVWLWGQGAKIDRDFVRLNKLDNLLGNVKSRLIQDPITSEMKRKLAPFLFVARDEGKLDLFPQVIEMLENNNEEK